MCIIHDCPNRAHNKTQTRFLIPLKFNICKQSLYVTARIKSYPWAYIHNWYITSSELKKKRKEKKRNTTSHNFILINKKSFRLLSGEVCHIDNRYNTLRSLAYLNPGVITVPPTRTIFSANCFLVSIGHCRTKVDSFKSLKW